MTDFSNLPDYSGIAEGVPHVAQIGGVRLLCYRNLGFEGVALASKEPAHHADCASDGLDWWYPPHCPRWAGK